MTNCPFCNAELPDNPTRQAACPRCGEIVPTAATSAVVNRDETPATEERMPNGRIALFIVGAMLTMATIGLVFALNTTEHRRSIDTRGQEKAEPAAATNVKPTELAGLGYVPNDTQVLLGIHVAQLRAHPAGEALLRRLRAADDHLFTRLTDHVVVGLNGKALPPRVTFVAQSPNHDDSGRLEVGYTPATKWVKRGDRGLSKHRIGRLGFEFWVGRADSKTVVACQLPEDFDTVPTEPLSGTERFGGAGSLLSQRIDPASCVWLAGNFPPENALFALMTLLPLPASDRLTLQSLQSVAASLSPDGSDLTLIINVQGRDTDSSVAIADWLERSLGAAGVIAKRSTDGDWQRLTANLNADAIAKWFTK